MIHAERPLAYMVGLDLAGRRCVVLGGGEVAAARTAGLLDAGALVTVIADRLCDPLARLAAQGSVAWTPRGYVAGDLRGAFLVFNASADADVEAAVSAEARAEGALLNTHDRPRACDFASPALVRRGRLQIAISTSGDSPFVAAAVRSRLERLFGEEWAGRLARVARARRRLRREHASLEDQQRTYARLMRGAGAAGPAAAAGRVHLVGAGPGDAALITVAAQDRLLEADVVFHDALVSPEVLSLCDARATLVNVGKRGGGAGTSQADINSMLIDAARSGLEVVRLKGGDPFVFGRGGEELDALRAAGIEADVVPGISSAFAAAAAAGIPVTHRDLARSVAVVTGRDSAGQISSLLEDLARAVDTLVVLMPLEVLRAIADRLIPVLGGDCPAAVISNATTPHQRTVRAPLSDIAERSTEAGLQAPATLVLGEVVRCLRPPERVATREASAASLG